MKFATGKTARAIRRRELLSYLLTNIEHLAAHKLDAGPLIAIHDESKKMLIELYELSVIDANSITKPRKRQ